MLFTNLKMDNYKIYYGEQIFDFTLPPTASATQKKNLILIGGLNGRGKTTILNAIYYALFGSQGSSEPAYKQTFAGALNDRHFEEGGRECSVALSFIDDHNSEEEITVKVTWQFDSKKVLEKEQRTIYKKISEDTVVAVNMSEQEYFEFINQRIPFEVAQFFIFDGEKIQQLVEKQDQKLMKQSIQKIVSIEVYKELANDLAQLQASLERKTSTKNQSQQMSEVLENLEKQNNLLEKAQKAEMQLEGQLQELEEKKVQLNIQRRQKLAQNTESSIEIQKYIKEYEVKIEEIDKQLNHFLHNGLPRLLLAPLIKKMQKRLEDERTHLSLKSQAEAQFSNYEVFINQLMNTSIVPPLSADQMKQLMESGKQVWASLNRIKPKEIPEMNVIHDIAPGTRNALLKVSTSSPQNVRKLIDQKLNYKRILAQFQNKLENAPDPIDTNEEDQMLEKLVAEIGEKKARLKSAKATKLKSKQEIESLQKKYASSTKVAGEQIDSVAQYQLVSKLRNVADRFVEKVTLLKAQKIKYEFSQVLDRLVSKGQDFQEIEFDDKDFVIHIYNDKGTEIKLVDRSAGEKQIIALSFIWALTKTAGLNLPFVVDTPLGRLDSLHRNHIIQHYFSLLSDQVIILSTDTEITQEYHKQVQNYLVRSYELVYDQEEKHTSVREGYFSFN